MAPPQPKYVDVRQKYPDGEQRRKVLVAMRPCFGIVDKDGVFKEDASGMDALIVLVRAMTAYGWKPSGNMSVVEAALHKTALMDLGWDAQADRRAKGELAAVLGEEISVDMFCSEQLEGFAQVHPDFEFIDRDYLHWEEPGPWTWEERETKRCTTISADGTRSMQKVMDDIFALKSIPSDTGNEKAFRRFGRCAKFIHVSYNPTQVQTFENLCRFDLRTSCLGDKVNGKRLILHQEGRYHILAIARISEDGEDIRVYNQVNSVIAENPRYVSNQPSKNTTWTVESCEDKVEFRLIYYRVRDSEGWPHKIEDIKYRPVEYISTKNVVEASGSADSRPLAAARNGMAAPASRANVPPSSRSVQPNSDPRNRPHAVPISQARPGRMLPGYGGMDNNFNPPTAPRAMMDVDLNQHAREQRAATSSGRGGWASDGRGLGSGGDRERGLGSGGGRGRSSDRGRDSRLPRDDIRKNQSKERAPMSQGRSQDSSTKQLDYGSSSTSKAQPAAPLKNSGGAQIELFEGPSEPEESDNEAVEPQRTRDRLKRQEVKNAASRDLLNKKVHEHWPLSAAVTWAEAMKIPDKLRLDDLAHWCREGCVSPGPLSNFGTVGELQAALGALHFHLQWEETPKWTERKLKELLYDVNVKYRQIVLEGKILKWFY